MNVHESLDFREISALVNASKTTELELEPTEGRAGGWAMYEGRHRIRNSVYPFKVLHLLSSATRPDIGRARAISANRTDVEVVFPPSLEKKFVRLRAELAHAKGVYTYKEYLKSFIKDELDRYITALSEEPKHFIESV